MGLPWVRLETQFPQNAKVIVLADRRAWRALFVYCCSLSYAGAQGTDGFIPTGALPFIHGTRKDGQQLAEVGLWDPCQGGWQIPDWLDYQQGTKETEERKMRMKALAEMRWNGHAQRNA